MRAEEAIHDRLSGDFALGQIVGDAVYGGRVGEKVPAPYVLWRRVSGSYPEALDGGIDLCRGRFQVDCYAETYGEAVAIARAVIDAVRRGNDADCHATAAAEIDLYDDTVTPKLFRRVVDFETMERTA